MKVFTRIFRLLTALLCIGLIVELVLASFFSTITKAATHATTPYSRHVIILPLDYVTWEDFINPVYPAFQQLAQQGAVGLATMNTGNGHGAWNEYASYSEGEPAQVIPIPLSSIQQTHDTFPIDWYQTIRQQKKPFDLGVGGLGQSIRDAGFVTGYIGALKLNDTMFHPAPLFVIDKQGNIPYFTPDGLRSYFILDRDSAAGVRDSVHKLIAAVDIFLHGKSGFLTVGMGDLARLEQEREHLAKPQYSVLRKQALTGVNDFIQAVLNKLSTGDTLLIMNVTPATEQTKMKEWLGPVAMVGPKVGQNRILTSKTTRQQGIVANIDIVPTILQQLGVYTAKTLGHPLEAVETSQTLHSHDSRDINSNLQILGQKLRLNSWYTTNRASVLICLAVIVVIIWIGCLFRLVGWFSKANMYKWNRLSVLICSGCCLLPVMFLLTGAIHRLILVQIREQWVCQIPFLAFSIWVFLTAMVCALPVLKLKDWNWRLLYLGSFMFVVYGILLFVQNGAFAQSLLGFDPVYGARYYGIGNEYMAGFVTSWFMVAAAVVRIFGKCMLTVGWFVSGLLTLYLASPAYGANIGGAVTIGLGSVLLLYRIHVGGWDKRGFFVIGSAFVIMIAMIAGIQEVPNFPSSHARELIKQLARRDWEFASLLINRKIEMNFNMLQSSPFWLGIGGFVLAGTAYAFMQNRLYKQWKRQQHPFYQMIITSIVAALIGYLANDSGVIVSLLVLYPILFVILGWMNEEGVNENEGMNWRLLRIQIVEKFFNTENSLRKN